jgi:hypothetical protein
MADFCKQCSIEHFGKDFGELKNPEPLPPDHFWLVLCEGCGVIQIDSDGACVSKDCLRNGHTNEAL